MSEKVVDINKKAQKAKKEFLEMSKTYIEKKAKYMRISMDLYEKKGELDRTFQKEHANELTEMELLGKELDEMSTKMTDIELAAAGIERPKKEEKEKKNGQK